MGAISGALAGAQAGCTWVPQRWWEPLVQRVRGRRAGGGSH